MKKIITTLALAATAFSLTASATLISVERSEDGVIFGPGTFPASPDYTPDAFDVPNDVFVWEERIDFTNDEDFNLDTDLAVPDAKYGRKSGDIPFNDQSGPMIAAGQLISSYYAYYDPSGGISKPQTVRLTFDAPILGIIMSESGLLNSDHLRVLAAPYAGNFALRGGEPGADFASLSADRKTLTLNITASTPGDQFRIIAGESGIIPEPTTMALVGGACLFLALVGRKRRA